MDSKKAAIMVSMSWIFMAVIGVFFFIMAYNVVGTYKQIEEDKFNLELKQAFRNIFNSVGRTRGDEKDSLQPFKGILRDRDVEIRCVENFPTLYIDGQVDSNNQFLQTYPTVSTKIIGKKVDDTYIAVLNYKMPFKITNILALVSERHLIVFEKDKDVDLFFTRKIKDESSFEELNIDSFETIEELRDIAEAALDNELSSLVIVSDKDSTLRPDIIGVIDTKLSKIHTSYIELDLAQQYFVSNINYVYSNDEDFSRGEDNFYNYIDTDSSHSLAMAALMASPNSFDCAYNVLGRTIPETYGFYINKTLRLRDLEKYHETVDTTKVEDSSLYLCESTYSNDGAFIAKYESMFNLLDLVKNEFEPFNFESFNNAQLHISNIEDTNEYLEDRCQNVY